VSPDGPERPATPLPRALLVVALALAALHLALPLATVPRLLPANYNEGWNAYHAEAVFSARSLYPPPADLFPNNYPPLSFVVTALLSRLAGDPLLWGRLLSLLAVIVIAAEIAWLVCRATGSARHGAFANLLFVALLGAAYGDYIGIADPQLLAHAFVLGGALLLAGGRSARRTLGAAVLMSLGGLAKHNLFALPLAVVAWLWLRDRAACARFLAASAACVALASLGLWLAFGVDVFTSILGARQTSADTAARMSADWLQSLAAPLALGLLAWPAVFRDAEQRWIALYAALALVLGVVFTAGEGVSYNAFFDLVIALALLGGLLLARGVPGVPSAVLAVALLFDPLLQAPRAWLGFQPGLERLERREAATRKDVDFLAARAGPALCEALALCYWAGKAPAVDLFNAHQAFWAGRADERELERRIAEGEFSVIQLGSLYRGRDDLRISERLSSELLRSYVPERSSSNGVFLRPRRGAAR
jgi:hypothetical protein